MTDGKRLIADMLRGRAGERVGLCENIWGQTLSQWVEQGYPTDDDGQPVSPVAHFGFDMRGVPGALDLQPLRDGLEVIEETDEWRVTRDGAGASFRQWKDRAGVPEHVDFRMTSRDVWERDYRPHLLELDPERLRFDQYAEALEAARRDERFAMQGSMFIWEYMRHSFGDVTLYQSLLADPDWIQDYGRVYTDFFKAHLGHLWDRAGAPDGYRMCEDLGYSAGLFASVDTLRELIFPYFKELVDFFHERGVLVFLHTCGGVGDAVELIAETGFDGMDPMERKAGCEPFDFAERVGDRLVLRGGLDVRILERGDRDDIRREAAALIDGMKSRGARYVFGSDHSISTAVSYDAYRWALDAYHERKMY